MNARRLLSLSGLALAAGLGAGPAQAGFWDSVGEMFGGGGQRQEYYAPRYERSYERSRPMYIDVNPRRRRVRPPVTVHRHSPPVDRKAPVVAHKESPKPEPVKAVALDPNKDPKWFLHDPTLRRGDMVVLKGGVLVFARGGSEKSHAEEDFVSLKDSQVPKATRLTVEKLTTAPSRAQVATAE